jgi:hypothetical protein
VSPEVAPDVHCLTNAAEISTVEVAPEAPVVETIPEPTQSTVPNTLPTESHVLKRVFRWGIVMTGIDIVSSASAHVILQAAKHFSVGYVFTPDFRDVEKLQLVFSLLG